MYFRSTVTTAVLALVAFAPVTAPFASAQAGTNAPAATQQPQHPLPQNSAPANRANAPIPQLDVPPSGDAANPFPKPDPRNFTADTPTMDTVNAFLHASWGYDPQRVWQVQAISKTPVTGISKVVVLVAQKTPNGKPQMASLQFFTLPDGKHLIADDVLPFGAKPFADYRALLEQRADGPARGSASKDLLLVEFADFQCPHCKEAQPTIEKLLQQYPNARFVYENYPLVQIHSEAYKASAYSVCVAKLGGNDAFFKYSNLIFDAQSELTPQGSDAALKGAVTKVGLDPAKVAACSTSAEAKSTVDASLKLGQDLNLNQTPILVVNGRVLPIGALPIEALSQLVAFQAQEDGVKTGAVAAPAPTLGAATTPATK
jgi:protein-disulfide isomerase